MIPQTECGHTPTRSNSCLLNPLQKQVGRLCFQTKNIAKNSKCGLGTCAEFSLQNLLDIGGNQFLSLKSSDLHLKEFDRSRTWKIEFAFEFFETEELFWIYRHFCNSFFVANGWLYWKVGFFMLKVTSSHHLMLDICQFIQELKHSFLETQMTVTFNSFDYTWY